MSTQWLMKIHGAQANGVKRYELHGGQFHLAGIKTLVASCSQRGIL